MEEDEAVPVYSCDVLCDRAHTIRDIAAQLGETKDRDARKMLLQAADAVLLGMLPKAADILTLVPKKEQKERPL